MKALKWFREEAAELYHGLTHTDDKFSSTKFFSSVAYAVVTWVVVHQELKGTLSTEMVLTFLGVVAGHNVLLRNFKKDETK